MRVKVWVEDDHGVGALVELMSANGSISQTEENLQRD